MNSIYDDIDNDLKIVRDKLIQDQYAKYRKIMDDTFANNTMFNLSSVPSHAECLHMEDELTKMDDLFILITELGANITHSISYQEAYFYAVQIPPLYQLRKQYDPTQFNDIEANAKTTCGWLNSYSRETGSVGKEALEDFEKITDDRDTAVRQFDAMGKLFSKLHMMR